MRTQYIKTFMIALVDNQRTVIAANMNFREREAKSLMSQTLDLRIKLKEI